MLWDKSLKWWLSFMVDFGPVPPLQIGHGTLDPFAKICQSILYRWSCPIVNAIHYFYLSPTLPIDTIIQYWPVWSDSVIVINMSKNRNHIYPTDIHSFCTLGFALGLLVVSKLFDKVHTGFLKKKNTSSHGDCLQMATMILHSNDPHVGVWPCTIL